MYRTPAVVATVVTALVLTGCAAGSAGGESDASGETLRLGLFVQPTTFSAQDAAWGNESIYIQAVYDTLLISDTDGAPQPHLATSWEYNDDNTVLTLELRDDVTFTDGTPFTADVAAQNLIRFRDGSSSNAAYGQSIADAAAVDDDTLQITLTAPDPAFLGYLAFNLGAQESPEAFDDPDIQTDPVGSGPYLLDTEASVTGSSYRFTANPDYWAPELQHYDEIFMNVYMDATAMLAAIQAGELDAANLANNDALDQVESAGFTISSWEHSWYGLFLFDRAGSMNPALADVRVRQAINYAFDADGMLQTAGGGHGTQTGQIFPERSVAFDPELDSAYAYDPEKATGPPRRRGVRGRPHARDAHGRVLPRRGDGPHPAATRRCGHHGELHRCRHQLHRRHPRPEVPPHADAAAAGFGLGAHQLLRHARRDLQPDAIRGPEGRRPDRCRALRNGRGVGRGRRRAEPVSSSTRRGSHRGSACSPASRRMPTPRSPCSPTTRCRGCGTSAPPPRTMTRGGPHAARVRPSLASSDRRPRGAHRSWGVGGPTSGVGLARFPAGGDRDR